MAAAAVGILVVLLVTSAEATVGPSPGVSALRPQTAGLTQANGRQAAPLTGCEQRLLPARRPGDPACR